MVQDEWSDRRNTLQNGWFTRGSWKAVDPLYVWSAAIGLFVSLVLIAIAMLMQTDRPY